MQNQTVSLLALVVFVDGCFLFNNPIDPCAEGSPLQQDPKVAADCQQCSMSPCPDEGETGEDPPGDQVTVAASDHRYAFDGVNLPSTNAEIAVPGGVVEISRVDDCHASDYRDYECNLNWNGTPAIDWADNRCVACSGEGGIDYNPGNDPIEGWPTCQSNVNASLSGAWVMTSQNGIPYPTCTPNAFDTPDWTCAKGHVQIWEASDPATHGPAENWTCRCPDGIDSQCQPGAACEAAWRQPYNGILKRPTLCTWDDGEGDMNGAAPEGPIVYGLDAWEDGIELTTVRGVVGVRVTPSFLLSLTGPAPWNDDQRFDVTTGELTYCGEDALCDWLGLTAGDRLQIPTTSGLELLSGRELQLVVEHVDGATTTFAVSIEFDGDLTD